jgi:DNA polymerase III epsilon subunit-like protein
VTDVMLDLETLGLRPGSVILSIGAIAFDPEAYTLDREGAFYEKVLRKPQEAAGLRVDPDTVAWWAKQNKAAYEAATVGAKSPEAVFLAFSEWYKLIGATEIWACGANFDIPLLDEAMQAFGLRAPWHYQAPRDVRTVCDLAGGKLGSFGSVNPLQHDALQDAIFQATEVMLAIRKLCPEKG